MENQEKDHFPSFENHCSLWYSSIDDLPTSDDQWNEFTANLSTADRARVTFFHFADDQKRSYLSLRLQRSLIEQTWHLKDNQYDILRTMEQKPFAETKFAKLGFWNYNVSHHGKYVAILSHDQYLCGVDLVDFTSRSPGLASSFNEFISMFSSQFHVMEIRTMKLESSEESMYLSFYVNWALKEAFVKAVGTGLSFNLLKARFYILYDERLMEGTRVSIRGKASVFFDDIADNNWRFEFWNVDAAHIIATAMGPLFQASESYIREAWTIDDKSSIPLSTDINDYSILSPSKLLKYKAFNEI